MLPHLEHMHWNQVAVDYEDLAIKDAFEEITLGFMEDALKKTASKQSGETIPSRRCWEGQRITSFPGVRALAFYPLSLSFFPCGS